ncbi:multicopper oxidase family protein [Thalassobacillus hwangdonensis]|uniref:Multicopper oxidase family protein n=1 Tax=Thalassobacillus hwangdonensis TaxID=546108 RepID=A0ABW3L6G1_9BACI
MNRKVIGSILIIFLLSVLVAMYFLSSSRSDNQTLPNGVKEDGESILNLKAEASGDRPIKEFKLTAKESDWKFDAENRVQAWTYNGTVPGKELRVQEGDYIKVDLKNELDVPVTIHWHGVILPNKMDGVPGLTQDAVQPGETFMYEFVAGDAGTYWYHSHQHSSEQVDKGLYGMFIVEEKEKTYAVDQSFILDEWAVNSEKESMSNMAGMMSGSMQGDGEADTKEMYDTYTVNGKTASEVEALVLEKGEKARVRLVNAGYQQHRLVFPEGTMKVIEVDGEAVKGTANSSNVLEIAPGERMDVEITQKKAEPWVISGVDSPENSPGITIPVSPKKGVDVTELKNATTNQSEAIMEGTSAGSEELIFNEEPEKVDVSYTMDLNMGMNMGEGMVFQINNDTFPDTPPIRVEEGDVVKVDIKNSGRLNHPMHLHGHRFQVASKNGEKYDSPIVKDLLNVKPGETYVIYFKADNKGEWLFHCHDNNHADRGMVTVLDYEGVYSPFGLDGKADNQPN